MTQENSSASGANQAASGDAGNQDDHSKDTVAYTTYQKVLGEKKKRDADLADANKKLADLEAKEKERAEAELKQKENWKALLETREKELAEERAKRTEVERDLQDGMKLDAFLKSVSGKIDQAYLPLVPISEIAIDPQTGLPDQASVASVAKSFEKKYARVIERASGTQLPNDAARGGGATLSYEEWLKLPTKDMKARYKDVIGQK